MLKLIDYFKHLNGNKIINLQSTSPVIVEYNNNFDSSIKYIELQYLSVKFANLPLISDDSETIDNIVKGVVFANLYKWEKLFKTLSLEYNPIWNVEGVETHTTEYGTHINTEDYGEHINSTNEKGFTFPNDDITKTQTAENDITNTLGGMLNTKTSEQHTDKLTIDKRGNIGVTSTQNLICQERDIAMFDFWQIVYDDIVKGITIPVWAED